MTDSYMKKLYIILIVALFISCQQAKTDNDWKIIYKNDKEGNTLLGSKQNVIDAIRNGADIKIGWGFQGKRHTIEHLSTPIWLAVLDGKEVTARLDPHISGTVDWENLTSTFKDTSKLKEEWRVIITTKGEFDAIWYDRKNDTLIKRVPQNHIMTWFSKNKKEKPKPLFSN